ncbi:MAG TPA: hypothetical protein VNP03_06300 [Pseudonocardia sp.]|nr:hypothetical protein [Pseudonocardia sp.]
MNRLAALGRERLAAAALVVGAVAFAATGLARLIGEHDLGVLTLPLALLAADLFIAGALVTRWYTIRPVAQGLAIFGALVHALVLLRSGPWWIRGWSGLLTAAHVYALALFFAMSAQEYSEDDEDGYDDEPERWAEPDQPAAPTEQPTEQPAEQPAELAPEQPPETPAEVADETPADQPAPIDRPAEVAAVDEIPAEVAHETPADEIPTDQSPDENPADEIPTDQSPDETPADDGGADAPKPATVGRSGPPHGQE